MATVHRFEDLEIWRKSRFLAKEIYTLTNEGPLCKNFRLRDQMGGSCGSVMDNIAKGFERGSKLEFINSLTIAKGETGELKSQLYRCTDAGYISETKFKELYSACDELTKMITSFIAYLNKLDFKGQKFKDRTNA